MYLFEQYQTYWLLFFVDSYNKSKNFTSILNQLEIMMVGMIFNEINYNL